ncbi:DUF4091 domain-containing protein [Helcococcus kunzii]|uniref:DUF4091 domain-containing protein n=1 Tax=Helcococcus kunzii TaxID=40091 RepID=UPI0021A7B7FD|nr:DUF4091 domain-containing protein [Helcococcus kunzii]MCT1795390.1 DUF4091 domain-containing protein [Helcococcus kunzii]MCT1989659.1 DUF4091 domain-containing protein [Helcococcus kunzii]
MALLFKIVDSNLNFNNINLKEFNNLEEVSELNSWKNDVNIIHVLAYSDKNTNISLDLEKTSDINYTIYSVKKSKVYGGEPVPPIPLYTDEDRVDSSDILIKKNEIKLSANEFQSFFIEIYIDKNFQFDHTDIKIKLEVDSKIYSKNFTINIDDKIVDFSYHFDIELWQYPYRVAEYYNVEAFSEKHLDILRQHIKPYKSVGGEFTTATLCEDAWGGQTYGKGDVKYPSMIKWIKTSNGVNFDYTDFDKWIDFCLEENIAKKIIVYGMAPWHQSFTYYEDDKLIYEKVDFDSEKYMNTWKIFLTDFISHLEDKNIFEKIYLGIDEQGFCKEVFDAVEQVKNSKGETLKIAAAIDNYTANAKYAEKVSHVSVSMIEFEKDRDRFYRFLDDRRNKGKTTLLYSCVGHKPGNFSLSQPGETYFTIVSASLADGFLRWAYDAWVKEPIKDATHKSFEPGDCFLVYPSLDEKYLPNISIRLLKIKEALYDVYKIRERLKYDKETIMSVLNNCNTKIVHSTDYLNKNEINKLNEDIKRIKELF